MGTWGPGAFRNDDALDWFTDLTKDANPQSFVLSTLEWVAAAEDEDFKTYDDLLEAGEACAIIAAAEIVAASSGMPEAQFNTQVRDWLAEHPMRFGLDVVRMALAAVCRVMTSSQWAVPTSDGSSVADQEWLAELRDLARRLSGILDRGPTKPT